MKGGHCSSCKALIVWAETINGKPIPIDAGAVASGNIGLEQPDDPRNPPIAHVAPRIPVEKVSAIRFVSHFATCPDASEHRRK